MKNLKTKFLYKLNTIPFSRITEVNKNIINYFPDKVIDTEVN